MVSLSLPKEVGPEDRKDLKKARNKKKKSQQVTYFLKAGASTIAIMFYLSESGGGLRCLCLSLYFSMSLKYLLTKKMARGRLSISKLQFGIL